MKTSIEWIKARLKELSTLTGLMCISGGIYLFVIIPRFPQWAAPLAGAFQTIALVLLGHGAVNVVKNDTPQPPTPPHP